MIPPQRYFNKPFLQILSTGKTWRKEDIAKELAKRLNLTKEDLKETTKGGGITRFNDRITWVVAYLKKAGLIKVEERGYYQITDSGLSLLEATSSFECIDNNVLSRASEDFNVFQNKWREKVYKGVRKKSEHLNR